MSQQKVPSGTVKSTSPILPYLLVNGLLLLMFAVVALSVSKMRGRPLDWTLGRMGADPALQIAFVFSIVVLNGGVWFGRSRPKTPASKKVTVRGALVLLIGIIFLICVSDWLHWGLFSRP